MREIYCNTTLPRETRKALNRQPIFTPKTTGKEEEEEEQQQQNPKQQKERNYKDLSGNKWGKK